MSKVSQVLLFFSFLIFLAGLSACSGPYTGNQSFVSSNENAKAFGLIGFSVGGAKDIENFRQNILKGFLPLPTDLTYEGLFYDYFFDTGMAEPCDKLFCPSYTSAISKDPFSEKEEYFLSVGLNSGIKDEDFSRKKLKLVLVIDISGSMNFSFERYHYDGIKNGKDIKGTSSEEKSEEDLNKTKIKSAAEAVVALLGHLKTEDSVGVVVFSNSARVLKPLEKIKDSDTDLKDSKDKILKLEADGGTNMFAGMEKATEMFNDYHDKGTAGEVENRIIFLTDAQPNRGDISEEGVFGLMKSNADQKVYTSFIGIGVDFNTKLIEAINKVRGTNYYAVHSPLKFKKRMDDEFDFMVTPLVFDLELKVQADGFKIKKVYGSPEADEATGEIMKVATLFPSESTEEGTRGGVVLLHLEKVHGVRDYEIQLTVNYTDREGKEDSSSSTFAFKQESEFYDNTGIRKAIVLARYANLVKNWLVSENSLQKETEEETKDEGVDKVDIPFEIYYTKGIPVPLQLGPWERQSKSLSVSEEYKKLFKKFHTYFEKEMEETEDSSLDKELKILKFLAGLKASSNDTSTAVPPAAENSTINPSTTDPSINNAEPSAPVRTL